MDDSRADHSSAIESWRPVVGYEGHYEVSDLGRVRSVRTGRILRPNTISRYGHQQVKLCMLGRKQDLLVSRLVLEAFVGPGDGQQARHVNENDASNNALTNLAWGTQAENEADKKRHGSVVLSFAPHNVKRRERKARRAARLAAMPLERFEVQHG